MSHLVLYRKYRPQKFREIAGQFHIVKTITNQIKHNVIAHGYLFSGPRGIGKTTVARLIAKSLNCKKRKKDAEPCGACVSCEEISGVRSLDLIEIDAASNRGVDEMRDLREKISFTPAGGKYKIYIIDEAHMLTKEAFNALLKTLEEPPSHAVFILATTEIHKIPATIVSRVQRFDFKNLSVDEITGKLEEIAKEEKIDVSKEALKVIALNANGGMRDAASLLGQVMAVEDKKITLEEVESILGRSSEKAIVELVDTMIAKDLKRSVVLINNISEDGFDLSRFTKELVDYLRNVLLVKVVGAEGGAADLLKNKFTAEQINSVGEQAKNLDTGFIIRAVKLFSESESSVYIFPQLGLEISLVELLGDDFREERDEGKGLNPSDSNDSDNLPEKKDGQPKPENVRPNVEDKFNISSGDVLLKDESRLISESAQGLVGDLLNHWTEIVGGVKIKNYTAAAFLKQCVPAGEKDQSVYIVTRFDFHKEKLSEHKTRYIIEEVLMDKFNRKITVRFINEKEADELGFKILSKDNGEKIVTDALEIFGGEVVG